MKKVFFVLISLFVFSALSAQKQSSVGLGIFVAPNISYRSVVPEDKYYTWFTDYRDTNEKAVFCFASGINLNMDFEKPYGVEAGISYLENGFAHKKTELYNDSMYTHFSNNLKYSFVDMSAGFNYRLTKNRVKFYISLGASLETLISSTITYHYFENDKQVYNEIYRNILDTRRFVLSAYWSTGLSYGLKDDLSIFVSPVIIHNLTSVIKPDIKEFLVSGNIRIGVIKTFAAN